MQRVHVTVMGYFFIEGSRFSGFGFGSVLYFDIARKLQMFPDKLFEELALH